MSKPRKPVTIDQAIAWFKVALERGPFPNEDAVAPLVQAINSPPIVEIIARSELLRKDAASMDVQRKILSSYIKSMNKTTEVSSRLKGKITSSMKEFNIMRRALKEAGFFHADDKEPDEKVAPEAAALIAALDRFLEKWPARPRGRPPHPPAAYYVANYRRHVVSALKAAGSRRLGLATPDSPACGVLHIIAKEVFGMRNTTPSTFVEINKEISDRPIQMGDILPRRK